MDIMFTVEFNNFYQIEQLLNGIQRRTVTECNTISAKRQTYVSISVDSEAGVDEALKTQQLVAISNCILISRTWVQVQ